MQTSRLLRGQVRRALLVAGAFTACINASMLVAPLFALHLFETAVPAGSMELLVVLGWIAAAALLAAVLLDTCRELILLRAGLWLEHTLGQRLLATGLSEGLPPDAIRDRASALGTLRATFAGGVLWCVLDLPWAAAAGVLAYLLHPLLGLAFAATAGALLLCVVAVQLATAGSEIHRERAHQRTSRWLDTAARNTGQIASQGLADVVARQWAQRNQEHVASAYASGRRAGLARAAARSLCVAMLIAVLALGSHLMIQQELTAGGLLAALLLLARVMAPLEQLVLGFGQVQAAHRAWQLLKAVDADPAALDARPADAATAIIGRVVVSQATFSYPDCDRPALRDINLTIEPGACIGIIGAAGSGKSALAALIAGAVVPATGAVEFDGTPLRCRRTRARTIGYMPDEPRLIEGSVGDNIAGFAPHAIAMIATAAVRAGVHEMLSGLPSGYDTDVGPDGGAMPLRTRRAIALARAVAGQPSLIVLDEPEIGRDAAGIERLVAMLQAIKADGIGLVLATQEPRLLRLTDRIVVLSAGAIDAVPPSSHLAGFIDGTDRARHSQAVDCRSTGAQSAAARPLRQVA